MQGDTNKLIHTFLKEIYTFMNWQVGLGWAEVMDNPKYTVD